MPERILDTLVTYLEMTAPPAHEPPGPPVAGLEIRQAREPTVSFYRYLYDAVGRDWTWTERKLLSDAQLAAIVQDPAVEVHVLWRDGVPAGYVELDLRQADEVEVAYFGLIPEFIGKGLGHYFLEWAVRHAWRSGPRRVRVHTCDLDHPRALPLYRRVGFEIYRRRRHPQPLPRDAAAPGGGAVWG